MNDQSLPINSTNQTHSSSEQTNVREPMTIQNIQTDGIDIGSLIEKKITNKEKYELFKNCFMPPDNFNFPASTSQNSQFQIKRLIDFSWLTYSPSSDAAFFQFCAFFSPKEVGSSVTISQALVSIPFRDWKNAINQFKFHQKLLYHKSAATSFDDILNSQLESNNNPNVPSTSSSNIQPDVNGPTNISQKGEEKKNQDFKNYTFKKKPDGRCFQSSWLTKFP